MLDSQNKSIHIGYLNPYREPEKVKAINERLVSENKVLRIEISNIKTVDKELAKRDG
jgi:regulator of replication initiation timing